MTEYIVSDLYHYCNVSLKKCAPIPKQTINFFDLTFVLEGQMTYTVNEKIINLSKNDAVFIYPEQTRTRVAGNSPVKYVSFNFSVCNNITLPFQNFMKKCITSDIRRVVSAYPFSHLSESYHSKEKCTSILNYILYELLDYSELQCDNAHVFKILKYINENINKKISLEIIAENINLSKEYTSYIFHREIGKNLIEYINEKKLILAKEQILSTNMSLSKIADNLGFDNYNYFSRIFKKRFGTTAVSLKHIKKGHSH